VANTSGAVGSCGMLKQISKYAARHEIPRVKFIPHLLLLKASYGQSSCQESKHAPSILCERYRVRVRHTCRILALPEHCFSTVSLMRQKSRWCGKSAAGAKRRRNAHLP
jgi:hypothetical protein